MFISHDLDGLPLAIELREQLSNYGIAAFVPHENGQTDPAALDRGKIQLALREMDGLVALVTRRFATNEWCNQELGFALGKGVHLQCIELANASPALAATSPQLRMPTDFDLPVLISRFVARDPLVSERLRPAVVELILQRSDNQLESGLRFLECLSWPGEGGATQLREARPTLSDRLSPEAMRRFDRLIERWQEANCDEQTHATIQLKSSRGASPRSREFIPLVGPI